MNKKLFDSEFTGLEVAIIGMSGRFPGADNIQEFWDNLMNGKESISRFDEDELIAVGVSQENISNKSFIKAKGVLPNLEYFDSDFFHYTPSDAKAMDPQVRILHEEVYHALEDSGYSSDDREETIGLFLGATNNFPWEVHTFRKAMQKAGNSLSVTQFNDKDYAATRIAYCLNLKGPAITLHSACSTSLVAIDLACRNLLTGSCQIAIAGGSGLTLPHKNGYFYQEEMIYSSDGHCKTFDKDADGTVEGNGVGIIVLKSLERALKDNDHIYAIIKGSAINNDGNRKAGFTAPSIEGQAEVIKKALRMSGVSPDSVSYVETHGTGTKLGDPVEIEALNKGYSTGEKRSCGIGSLKPNVGHLDVCSGVASLIKTTQILQHKIIPKSIHFHELNPNINLDNGPFYIVEDNEICENKVSKRNPEKWIPLRAGVSAFGIGGTNAHMILEEAPFLEKSSEERKYNVFCVTANTFTALEQIKKNFVDFLSKDAHINASDLAWTMNSRQKKLDKVWSTVYTDCKDLKKKLEQSLREEHFVLRSKGITPVYFLFSGQGSQYLHMAKDLYLYEHMFKEEIDLCFSITDSMGRADIKEIFLGEAKDSDERIHDTDVTQILLFLIEYSMAKLLIRWGIKPKGMIGHSIGELAAACIAGVFTLKDGISLVLTRGRLMSMAPNGAMTSVRAKEDNILHILNEHLSIAASNSDNSCTISGTLEHIQAFEETCHNLNIQTNRLSVNHAFHSKYMDSVLKDFKEECKKITINDIQIPYVSNVTGDWITKEDLCNPEYFCNHLRNGVLFKKGMETLLKSGKGVFIEVGPGKTLAALIRDIGRAKESTVINLLRHPMEDKNDCEYLANAIKKIWENGIEVNWKSYYQGQNRNKISLPLYPFDKVACPIQITQFQEALYESRTLEEDNPLIRMEKDNNYPTVQDNACYQIKWEAALYPINKGKEQHKVCIIFTDNKKNMTKLMELIPNWRGIIITYGKEYKFNGAFGTVIQKNNFFDIYRLFRDLKREALFGETILIDQNDYDSMKKTLMDVCKAAREIAEEWMSEIIVIDKYAICKYKDSLLSLMESLNMENKNFHIELLAVQNSMETAKAREEWRDILQRELESGQVNHLAVYYENNIRYTPNMIPMNTNLSFHKNLDWNHSIVIGNLEEIDNAIEHICNDKIIGEISFIPYEVKEKSYDSSYMNVVLKETFKESFTSLEDDFSHMEEVHTMVEEYATLLTMEYFNQLGILRNSKAISKEDIIIKLSMLDSLEKYVDYFLYLLEKGNYLKLSNIDNRYYMNQIIKEETITSHLKKLKEDIHKRTNLFDGQLELLEWCFKNYTKVFRGEVQALSVLYPDNNKDLLLQKYDHSIQEKEDQLLQDKFITLLQQLSQNKKKIRILEVGGGYGAIFRKVLPLLKEMKVDYCFTDIGTSYIEMFKEYCIDQECDFVQLGIFDITKSPEENGFSSDSFDLVFANNVVHATHRINTSLYNMKKALAPGGILCILERVRSRGYVDLVWGLAEGWWHFDISERQLSPLVTIEEWKKQFAQLGLNHICAFPEDSSIREKIDVGMIIGQKPYDSLQEIIDSRKWDNRKVKILSPIYGDTYSDLSEKIVSAISERKDIQNIILWDVPSKSKNQFQYVSNREDAIIAIKNKWYPTLFQYCSQKGISCSLISYMKDISHWKEEMTHWYIFSENMSKHYNVNHLYLFGTPYELDTSPIHLLQRMKESSIRTLYLNNTLYKYSSSKKIVEEKGQPKVLVSDNSKVTDLILTTARTILGYEEINQDADLFELGMDSFKLIQFTSTLENHGHKVLINEIYNNPTVKLLASYVEDKLTKTNEGMNSFINIENMLYERLGIRCKYSTVQNGQENMLLLFVDKLTENKKESIGNQLRMSGVDYEFLPHYIIPMSLEKEFLVNKTVDSLKLYDDSINNQEEYFIQKYFDEVDEKQEKLRHFISNSPIKCKYDLSLTQKRHFAGTVRLQLYLIQFQEIINEEILEKAFCDVIGSHGLMCSFLYKSLGKYRWKQFEAPRKVIIPKIDLSNLREDKQKLVIDKLIKKEWAMDFKVTGKPMYQVVLVKYNEKRSDLLFQFDHSIFDVTSGQIFRGHLLKRYQELLKGTKKAMPVSKSYQNLLAQVYKGPVNITPEEIIEKFNVKEYGKYTSMIRERIEQMPKYRIQQLRYSIDFDKIKYANKDDIEQFSLVVHLYTTVISKLLKIDKVAFDLLFQSRIYEDKNYADVMGMVLGGLPFVVNVDRNKRKELTDIIGEKIRFTNKYNISFFNMIHDIPSYIKYRKVAKAFKVNTERSFYSSCLLNFVGNVEHEYDRIWDFSMEQLNDENQEKLNYADCYGVSKIYNNRLDLLILCKFVENMDEIKKILDDEVKFILENQG